MNNFVIDIKFTRIYKSGTYSKFLQKFKKKNSPIQKWSMPRRYSAEACWFSRIVVSIYRLFRKYPGRMYAFNCSAEVSNATRSFLSKFLSSLFRFNKIIKLKITVLWVILQSNEKICFLQLDIQLSTFLYFQK